MNKLIELIRIYLISKTLSFISHPHPCFHIKFHQRHFIIADIFGILFVLFQKQSLSDQQERCF